MGLLVVIDEILGALNGLAGLAALINGALLWPVVRALKTTTRSHGRRLGTVERALTPRARVVTVKRPARGGRKAKQ